MTQNARDNTGEVERNEDGMQSFKLKQGKKEGGREGREGKGRGWGAVGRDALKSPGGQLRQSMLAIRGKTASTTATTLRARLRWHLHQQPAQPFLQSAVGVGSVSLCSLHVSWLWT